MSVEMILGSVTPPPHQSEVVPIMVHLRSPIDLSLSVLSEPFPTHFFLMSLNQLES